MRTGAERALEPSPCCHLHLNPATAAHHQSRCPTPKTACRMVWPGVVTMATTGWARSLSCLETTRMTNLSMYRAAFCFLGADIQRTKGLIYIFRELISVPRPRAPDPRPTTHDLATFPKLVATSVTGHPLCWLQARCLQGCNQRDQA